ncbi:electron transport protein [Alkalihalobacterium alkalinitrilicum]|uniref:electron transport protein n=1 Tax=Alkalihalobacterium alkalinitrilicum TaxID=427920 RepID=UPI0009950AAE|nr:electron transport protein [Alkalihalobacterium alkalinitrilicum]
MKKRSVVWLVAIFVAIIVVSMFVIEPEYAYIPPESRIMNHDTTMIGSEATIDMWGVTIQQKDRNGIGQTIQGQQTLSAENGAVHVDEPFVELGRELFYEETFGNEVFLTDILGMLDGPLTVSNIMKAIFELRGGHTNNLQVELAYDITLGDRTYNKGEKIDTGFDVPKGAIAPLGMPITFSDGRLKAGVSCAACHATVDRDTGLVIEGAPNLNFNGGLLIALASNSAAYFTNTAVDEEKLRNFITENSQTIVTKDGKVASLPDPKVMEMAVDEMLVKWPKGNFDSTMDLKNNPAQIPDSFTLGDHPYGWNGFAAVGPFKGLSSLNNNVHAQNSDILAQSEQSDTLFEIDKEVFIGTILQNAANENYRYDPASNIKPSEFLAQVDDTPEVPGVNEMVKPPNFPKVSLFTPNGTVISSPGFRYGEQINALSAFQNSLVPPRNEGHASDTTIATGREVFTRAGCITCHSGATYTNHRVIPVGEVKTEPSRAKAFQDIPKLLDEALTYSPDEIVPLREDAKVLKVPTDHLDEEQLKLTLAQDHDGKGGYKVKGLIGLAYSPPYLHDGGVAVGPNEKEDVGIAGTLERGIDPDPYNSLKALLDKKLRQKVIEANKSNKDLHDVHVQGIGHEYWVDQNTRFTEEEQQALIQFLLSITDSSEEN